MYVVTLLWDDDGYGPTFWYSELEEALEIVTEIIEQGYVAELEKVN